jgi:hypothetical protein
VIPQIYLFHFSCISANMLGSNSSIHGGHHGEEEPPVARAKLCQMPDSLLEAMERMLDAHMPVDGQRAPRHQYDESGCCWWSLSTHLYHQYKSKKERITCFYTHILCY